MIADYPLPVNQLLTLGEPKDSRGEWPDYLTYGLTAEHVPDLIRMATDLALNRADPNSLEVWAPLHAWRALGQLRAEAAVQPLLELLHALGGDHDDWAREELPEVFARIGPAALPALEAFLADTSRGLYPRAAIAEGLQEMVERHPETRDQCIGMLAQQLERAEENDPSFNGFLVAALLDLEAAEVAPVMERAFTADAVDESIAGGWQEVAWELGLSDRPPTRVRPPDPFPWLGPPGDVAPPRSRTAKAKAKARRKQAKASRKRNRKHG
jgi:hypothetical protein